MNSIDTRFSRNIFEAIKKLAAHVLSGLKPLSCASWFKSLRNGKEWRGALLISLKNFFFRLSFRSCLSCVVTARIFLLFDLSSPVQIYVSYIYIHLFILHGCITNSQYDQLPVGLIAQLVEHCTGIAEVMGSNPVQAWIFFRLSFRSCLSCVVTARIFLLFDLSSAVQIYVSYIYIQ